MAKASKSGDASRTLLYLLVGLIGLGLLGLAYLHFMRGADLEKRLRTSERQVETLKMEASSIARDAQRIKRRNTRPVKDLNSLIETVAQPFDLNRMMTIKAPSTTNLDENYMVTRVTFSVRERRGFTLEGFYRFLNAIELQNQNIQIEKVDFGERREVDEKGDVYWNITEIRVRVFRPRNDADA